MSARPGPERAADETLDDGAEEATLPEGEWPVPDLYRVEPSDELVQDEGGTRVVEDATGPTPPEVRRFPPPIPRGLVAALVAALLLLLAIPAGIWLTSRADDAQGADATGTQAAAEPKTTEPSTTAPASTAVDVPDVVGRPLSEARGVLERAGLRPRITRTESRRQPDEVVEQAPEAGASAERRSVVVLTVSDGLGLVRVPDVEGSSRAAASKALRDAGFRVRVSSEPSEERVGTVIAQSPAAGTEAAEGTAVELRVSTGPESSGGTPTNPTPPTAATVRVPNVVGLAADDAGARLRETGLRVSQRQVESSQPPGTVVSQSPSAGAAVQEGRLVTLQVSTGPAQLSVPHVAGLSESAAVAELSAAGFAVDAVDEATSDPAQNGLVLRQSPAAGTRAAEGATVTITVARHVP
jgi:beta-lactam-binding protein with PASTA domain